MKQVAPLRYGVIFKKAFCDVDVFKGFVRDILGIHLEIDRVETEKQFDRPIGRVKPEFDLFAEDKKNRVIVDIQHQRDNDHYARFLYYHCVALLEQIQDAYDYRPGLTVYTIVVLTSGDRHKCDVSVIDFDPKRLNGEPLREIKHKVIYVCPKYLDEHTPPAYREWLRVIEDSLDGQIDERNYQLAEVQKIIAYIEQDDISPEEKARMIEEYHVEERIDKKTRKIARSLLLGGVDKAIIAESTGLAPSEIEALADADELDEE